MEQEVLKELQKIPGVGKSISQDLYDLGYRSIAELKNLDPEEMYKNICIRQGTHVDRCMLYVFRCAVYYASNEFHDPALLKWWNWKESLIRCPSTAIEKLPSVALFPRRNQATH